MVLVPKGGSLAESPGGTSSKIAYDRKILVVRLLFTMGMMRTCFRPDAIAICLVDFNALANSFAAPANAGERRPRSETAATPARVPMMATTTNSSTRLKAVEKPFKGDLIPAGDVVNIIGVASIWCAVCKS